VTKLDHTLCQQQENKHRKIWGAKHIKVLGIKDKRQVTLIVSSFVDGLFLPLQIVFIGTTHRTLPPNNEGKFMRSNNGWDLTFSENHWSTFETTKRFAHKILLSYLHSQIKQLGLPEH
jgi:hypothetical protein